MDYISKIKKERDELDAQLAIFESFPDEVKTLKFAIFPGKDPWVSFKDCTFETLQIIRKAFPALPAYWDRNGSISGASAKEKPTATLLSSPYFVSFNKLQSPNSGEVTVRWYSDNLTIWCSMTTEQYSEVTDTYTAIDVHRKSEYENNGNYGQNPMATTAFIVGFGNTRFWGNSITSYCLENQDANKFEAAVFTGSFERVLPEGEPIKYTLSDDRAERLGILREIPFEDVRVGDLIAEYRKDKNNELPVFFEILEIRPSGVHMKAFKGQGDWVLYPGNYIGLTHIIAKNNQR